MSISDGAALTVDAMRSAGRLEAIDEALVAAYLALATELDLLPIEAQGRSSLFREFRAYHDALMAAGVTDDGDDLANLLASMSAPVGVDPPARSAD